MTKTCREIQELIASGSPDQRTEIALHVADCADCAATLQAAEEISAAAAALHHRWESPALWERIERSISGDSTPVAPPAQFRRSSWLQLAAAVTLVSGLGIGGWLALRQQPTALDQSLLTQDALAEVDKSEDAYVRSIDRLAKVVEPKMDADTSPLMVSYRDKLMLLDDAIAECRSSIEVNRQNAHLRRQLLAVYQEKQRTLQDILQEESNAQQNRAIQPH